MNKYNSFYYHKAWPYRFKSKQYNLRTGRMFKRTFCLLDIHLVTMGLQHMNNSQYYFSDQYKGIVPVYRRGDGVYDMKHDKLLKSYRDDPILGWVFNNG